MRVCHSAFSSASRNVTTNLYIPPDHIRGEYVTLPDEEVQHAVKVLRLKRGDVITAIDGRGGWYRIELDTLDRRTAGGHIVERRKEVGEPSVELIMACGLIKHRGRFETLLEKAVELGVGTVVPIITSRSERQEIRESRLGRILVAAMKQCGRSRLPVLSAPAGFREFLESVSDANLDEAHHEGPRLAADGGSITAEGSRAGGALKLICHEEPGAGAPLGDVLAQAGDVTRIVVLVGPEGGFTDEEIEAAVGSDFRSVSLGPRRLRAETAAIAAAAAVMLAFDGTSSVLGVGE